jgi:hypothetical protein
MTDKKQIFIDAFKNYKVEKPPVRVKINGQFIKTCTGKAGWQTVAHAKAAIKHHVTNMGSDKDMELLVGDGYSHERSKNWTKLLDGLVKEGVVEFC